MNNRFLHTVALVALAASCAFAQAQTPTKVGRIALAQGQVGISGELGDESSSALVNWPVTSRNQITTGPGARTEIRIGSTAVRLDADSALDVVELDDDNLRLHLHYGSATVRVRNPEVLRGFELSTPQGLVRMEAAGRLRVDAGRRRDTTSVTVFDGVALVDGGGSRLTLRAGKRAEIGQDDIRTGLATRDGFDEWGMRRDERDERSESVRYVTSEMTGYEDLDQNGVWRDDNEYGPLWSPRAIPVGWAPYRDGRWTFVAPWGWTWVDNAPWGYAPFHYGRWVMVNQRWCWAPGRNISRPVWSPALVGWVGGNNWNLSFNNRGNRHAAPARGWYPLAPRDTYVPTYRVDHDKLRYLNRHAGDVRGDIRGGGRRHGDNQRHGLTVVPQDQFNQRGTVAVRNAPQAIVSPSALLAAPVATAPVAPVSLRERGDGRRDVQREERRDDRREGRREDREDRREERAATDGRRFEREGDRHVVRGGRGAEPAATVIHVPPAAQPGTPTPATMGAPRPTSSDQLLRRERRQMEALNNMPTPAPAMPPVQGSPIQVQAGVAPSLPTAAQMQQREERASRFDRRRDADAERERRPRGAESYQQQVQQMQQMQQVRPLQQMQVQQAPPVQRMAPPVQQQVQPPAPQQQVQQMPMARPAAPPAPAAEPATAPSAGRDAVREERRRGRDEVGVKER